MNNELITHEQRELLLTNGRESLLNPDFDPIPVVKLFTPDVGATWLLTELDPDDHDHAFGLCDLGLGTPQLGWVSLQELMRVRGPLGLLIEPSATSEGGTPWSRVYPLRPRAPRHRGSLNANRAHR